MHITRVHIEGFKRFTTFDLELNPSFNIIVGDNETGKTSVLEAIGLVVTGQYDGRAIQNAIDPYLFNASDVADYFQRRQKGEHRHPPRVLIEAYMQKDDDNSALARLMGSNNSRSENCPGLVLTIEVDNDYMQLLNEYAADKSNPTVLPVEFYKATWRAFDNNGVNFRNLPFKTVTIDTSLAKVHRGPNKYVSQRVNDVLNEQQQRELSLAYKKMRHGFMQESGVMAINKDLELRGNAATSKKLTVQMDMSSRSSWDSVITPHLADLPIDCAGKGELCRVQMRLAIAGAEQSKVLLIEEPENHLSHSNLNMFMDDIRKDCADRQVIITTHSAFVLNKLGIDNLRLISLAGKTAELTQLTPDTKNYFMKLPGYDTLRLILSKRSILVEGPSDELIVQRAYKDKHGKLPLADGVDVIAVGSLAFKRFLEIAVLLHLNVSVVTDNDGKVEGIREKYADYLNGDHLNIRVYYDTDSDYCTLEPQLLKSNSLDALNAIFGKTYEDASALLKYMDGNKTDCALKIFETTKSWSPPGYIANAIE